jgi:hypothetical protein
MLQGMDQGNSHARAMLLVFPGMEIPQTGRDTAEKSTQHMRDIKYLCPLGAKLCWLNLYSSWFYRRLRLICSNQSAGA